MEQKIEAFVKFMYKNFIFWDGHWVMIVFLTLLAEDGTARPPPLYLPPPAVELRRPLHPLPSLQQD